MHTACTLPACHARGLPEASRNTTLHMRLQWPGKPCVPMCSCLQIQCAPLSVPLGGCWGSSFFSVTIVYPPSNTPQKAGQRHRKEHAPPPPVCAQPSSVLVTMNLASRQGICGDRHGDLGKDGERIPASCVKEGKLRPGEGCAIPDQSVCVCAVGVGWR